MKHDPLKHDPLKHEPLQGPLISSGPPLQAGAWSSATRDRSFLIVFAASLVAMFVVFGPFLDALILASAVVVVTWPLFESALQLVGPQRRYAAAGLTTTVVVL